MQAKLKSYLHYDRNVGTPVARHVNTKATEMIYTGV